MTSPPGPTTRSSVLSGHDIEQVLHLAHEVEGADGAPPLDESAHLRLTRAADGVEHLLLRAGDELVGYAQLDHVDPVTADVLVGPGGRRRDTARTLFEAVELAAGDSAAVSVWARDDAGPVRTEAEARGYIAARTLLTMGRSLVGIDTIHADLPSGVTIRQFVAGQDDEAWLAVNARAFSSHPEQGRWTQADLDDRIAQPWFDPAGFLLAVDADGRLLGFHWTKRHSSVLGEVYVIGMDPSEQGRGLGRTLLLAGLEHLRGAGAETVILYTDQENHAAVRMYANTGFVVTRGQTQYRRVALSTRTA